MKLVAGCALLFAASVAAADTAQPAKHTATVVGPPTGAIAANVLFLNRCAGGCEVKVGGYPGDAREGTSYIPEGPNGTTFTLSPFMWGDDDWNAFMQCMREVYSPYHVEITDVQPTGGTPYNEGIVAGIDSEINKSGLLGVAPVTSDCSPFSYVISFTFANSFGPGAALAICSVASQETGHAFGLDHEFEYVDGRSACNDPMSYRGDCGGQRFFRNESARCGEYSARPCGACGGLQNSHVKLLAVLGPGTPITEPPTVSIAQPAAGAQIDASTRVVANAYAQRGVKTVELYLNGYKWAEAPGAAFGADGQPESGYSLGLPPDVPDGVIDIVVRAKDDIDAATDTPAVRVTKGSPCVTADTCAAGQLCDGEGRCYWEPPAGELGDECTFEQFCKSSVCASASSGESRCTQECVPAAADACPAGFECLQSSETKGVCWPAGVDPGGCCSSSRGGAAQAGFLALVLAIVLRRRSR